MLERWTEDKHSEVSLELLRAVKLPDWPFSDTIKYWRCKLCDDSWAEYQEYGFGTWWKREPVPPE